MDDQLLINNFFKLKNISKLLHFSFVKQKVKIIRKLYTDVNWFIKQYMKEVILFKYPTELI